MKKIILMAAALAASVALIQSCKSDDDEPQGKSELEQKYISIEGATYNDANFPEATTDETIDGLDMSDQVMSGAMNYVTVVTEQDIQNFYIGIKNVPGYFDYTAIPEESRAGTYKTYLIPVMMSDEYVGNNTFVIGARLANGAVVAPVEKMLRFLETKSGQIEIKLAFSNSKDVDLHLFTPSGKHIYYGERGGSYTDEDGVEHTYGLDIDSNPMCNLDNKNKENIYIPEEFVEEGTYTVVVDMYANCNSSIATNWNIIARYQGQLLPVTSGKNPASGVYPVGAGTGDMTEVMTFTIRNPRSRAGNVSLPEVKPIPQSEMDINKIETLAFKLGQID